MALRTPLAWHNLTHSWRKCLLAASGVAFAVTLMFMQIGFRGALIDNNVQVMSLFDLEQANLAVISLARYNLSTEQRFPRYLLEAIAGQPEVIGAMALQMERGTSKIQVEGFRARPIRVLATELDCPEMFANPELVEKLEAARRHRAALVDRRSKRIYGFARQPEALKEQYAELNQQHLPLYDLFELGTDFSSDATILMPAEVYRNYFPWRNPGGDPNAVIDIGLLHARAEDAGELERIASQLQQLAPRQIRVLTTEELVAAEKRFWLRSTPIGKIFTIGTLLGLVVGAIICYQILFTDIAEHLAEFATLKAMGYRWSYFVLLVLWQSFYLALLGFIPGLLVSLGLYRLLTATSGLIMSMSLERVTIVGGLTLIMCATSGLLAMRKLFHTDPAELF